MRRRRSRSATSSSRSSRLGPSASISSISKLEQPEVAVAGAGALAQLVERALELARACMRGGHAGAQGELVTAAEAVEQVELGGGEHQAAMLVLAEERDEASAQGAEVGRRGGAALDERARAALAAHPAGEHHLLESSPIRSRRSASSGSSSSPAGSSKTPST